MENLIRIKLENCNNICNANFTLKEDELNLRYALNGTGKTTISKAIQLSTKNTDLSILHQFGSENNPKVEISKELNEVLVFDDDFINNTVFIESEVIENGFEVFIKSPEYDRRLETLNQKLSTLKISIEEDENFIQLTTQLNTIAKKLKLNADGTTVKNDSILKSLTAKENIYKAPSDLEIFKPFLQNMDILIDWVDWKTKGEKFDEISGCPFCTKDLGDQYETQKNHFRKTCKKANTKHLKEMLDLIESIKDFMKKDKYDFLIYCIKKESNIETVIQEITKLRHEVERIINKIGKIIQFNKLEISRDQISRIGSVLEDSKIAIASIDFFSSEKSIGIFTTINQKIESLKKIVDELKEDVGSFVGIIQNSIKNAKRDINSFLKTAGMTYELEIIQDNQNNAKTILKYVNKENEKVDVERIREHLSWGEKNAFSLVLFMHYALSRNADLIILDDPISSFDDNKNYAIINRLFNNRCGSMRIPVKPATDSG